ncbi:MAG: DUF1801 domain-containing protein [Chloroflexi bacterium]|nr:MAG: DUF1801 domain-containing protein [Chloroflexota bacterium]
MVCRHPRRCSIESMTVDEFVEKKVLPEFRPIVAAIRALMKECAPEAEEGISYGVPMYGKGRALAWITPGKTGVSLGFRIGASFADRYGLLRGAGKHARNVRMRSLDELNRPALKYYIKQAVKLDNR